jgi:hypothetical protein
VTKLAIALAATLTLACGGRDSPDDQTLHQDILTNASGAEVTFDATVVSDPVNAGDHERFVVKVPTGETLEVDHNFKLATYVPIHAGDHLVIHGKLYIDPGPRYGVHCTHAHTSGGCPVPGWIEFNSTNYE